MYSLAKQINSRDMEKHEHKSTPGNAEVCSDCGYLAYGPIHKPDPLSGSRSTVAWAPATHPGCDCRLCKYPLAPDADT